MIKLKNIILTLFLLLSVLSYSQEKGIITGKVLDKETNNDPLPFVNVLVKGTETGSTTDFDGFFNLTIEPGVYNLTLSFIGYQDIEIKNIIVNSGEITTIEDVVLSASEGVALDEVKIVVSSKKESFESLLGEQKKAVELKTSIGAEELSQKSVSNVAGAVSKISGISKEEGSNNVYVRGLSDRYLNTTFNKLPLPSNDINKKNIDLNLFTTNIIENVSVSKSYSPHFYADFSAGNVNITSKSFTGTSLLKVAVGTGFNTNAITQNKFVKSEGTGSFGFYNRYNHNPYAVILSHGVDPVDAGTPLNFNLSGTLGKSFSFSENSKLSLFISGSFKNNYTFKEGSEVDYGNAYNKRFPNVEKYSYGTNTTLLGSAIYKINGNHTLKYNSLFSNTSNDEVGYYGTKGNGYLRDSRSTVDTNRGFYQMNIQFNQDMIFVNQLLGIHQLSDNIKLDWGIGYNNVLSYEPDRKRISIEDYFYALDDDPNTHPVFLTNNSFDNQRYFQKMTDNELNSRIKLSYKFSDYTKLNIGYNGRYKTRDFENIRYGYKNFDSSLIITDVNKLNPIFNTQNVVDGLIQTDVFRALDPQNGIGPTNFPGKMENTYTGSLEVNGGYVSVEINLNDKWLIVPGIRAESFMQKINYDVINLVNNPDSVKVIEAFYLPSINMKYALDDNQNLRFSVSKTVSTPEFKEMAPFTYEGVTERNRGNPDLLGRQVGVNYTNVEDVSYSDILNVDLKYEWFLEKGQVFSLSGFAKQIKNPINLVVANDATGTQIYFRTGEKATIYGVEVELRKHLLYDSEENEKLTIGFNASYMHTEQDLYNQISGTYSVSFDKKTDQLQGASPFILNADVRYNFNLSSKINSSVNIIGNYFSDRVYALGSGSLGNKIEKGVPTLDFVSKNKISDKSELNFYIKNLLNPNTEITRELNNQENIILSSYKKGMNVGITYKYKF